MRYLIAMRAQAANLQGSQLQRYNTRTVMSGQRIRVGNQSIKGKKVQQVVGRVSQKIAIIVNLAENYRKGRINTDIAIPKELTAQERIGIYYQVLLNLGIVQTGPLSAAMYLFDGFEQFGWDDATLQSTKDSENVESGDAKALSSEILEANGDEVSLAPTEEEVNKDIVLNWSKGERQEGEENSKETESGESSNDEAILKQDDTEYKNIDTPPVTSIGAASVDPVSQPDSGNRVNDIEITLGQEQETKQDLLESEVEDKPDLIEFEVIEVEEDAPQAPEKHIEAKEYDTILIVLDDNNKAEHSGAATQTVAEVIESALEKQKQEVPEKFAPLKDAPDEKIEVNFTAPKKPAPPFSPPQPENHADKSETDPDDVELVVLTNTKETDVSRETSKTASPVVKKESFVASSIKDSSENKKDQEDIELFIIPRQANPQNVESQNAGIRDNTSDNSKVFGDRKIDDESRSGESNQNNSEEIEDKAATADEVQRVEEASVKDDSRKSKSAEGKSDELQTVKEAMPQARGNNTSLTKQAKVPPEERRNSGEQKFGEADVHNDKKYNYKNLFYTGLIVAGLILALAAIAACAMYFPESFSANFQEISGKAQAVVSELSQKADFTFPNLF